jgi:hypothetical protein
MVSSASTEPTIPDSVLTDLGNWNHRSFGTFECTETKGYLFRTRRVVELKSWQGVFEMPSVQWEDSNALLPGHYPTHNSQ